MKISRTNIVSICCACALVPPMALASEKTNEIDTKRDNIVEYGQHPRVIADAIVVLIPDEDMPLHQDSKLARRIRGKIISNERDRVIEESITHAPNSIVSPLRKGEPVKLFLKRYLDRNEYYIIGVFPADTPSGVKQ